MRKAEYKLKDDGTFVIKNYDKAKPFVNFLPGVADLWGIPAWSFYANRGQGISSFGTKDRNNAIMEFQSAGRLYYRTELEGFRTFIKIHEADNITFYEPFSQNLQKYDVSNIMEATDHDLTIEETNKTLGFEVSVNYHTVPNESFGGLIRNVNIRNIGHGKVTFEVLDGLLMFITYGMEDMFLKYRPRNLSVVLKIEKYKENTPFFGQRAMMNDESDMEFIANGNFYMGFSHRGQQMNLLPVVVDQKAVFGYHKALIIPEQFLVEGDYNIPEKQDVICETPCAFSYDKVELEPGRKWDFHSVSGSAGSVELISGILSRIRSENFFDKKKDENRKAILKIKHRSFVNSADKILNKYFEQSFLDNALRGGLPVTIKGDKKNHVLSVYSRKHGDPERDYNHFSVGDTFFAEGDGNFRDINQNRRLDLWHNPLVGTDNIKLFFNLIQADGFNPLVYKGAVYSISKDQLDGFVNTVVQEKHSEVKDYLSRPVSPGGLFAFCEKNNISLKITQEEVLKKFLDASRKDFQIEMQHGYWSDHWMYNADLIEQFLALFPDKVEELYMGDSTYTYYDDSLFVVPRAEKHMFKPGKGVRHYDSTAWNKEKQSLINSRNEEQHLVCTNKGVGAIYYSNLLGKIITLIVNKTATLSPSGIGMEMDGGRPGWNDSMNGLPGLFGAGVSEVFSLIRFINQTIDSITSIDSPDYEQKLPAEVYHFLYQLKDVVTEYISSADENREYIYWDKSNTLKEGYREMIYQGFKGDEKTINLSDLLNILTDYRRRLEISLSKSSDSKTGLFYSFITHEAIDFEEIKEIDSVTGELKPKLSVRGFQCVKVKKFSHHFLPLALEGPAHSLRDSLNSEEAMRIYDKVKDSPLYDKQIKMYKICAPLMGESNELGRNSMYPRSVSENESVFMHLEFKYLLGMLYSGLYDQFYEEIENCFPVYMDPAVYLRSPLENCSCIYSSVHERESLIGAGNTLRLSGVNAEVYNMLIFISFGKTPFTYNDGNLTFSLKPILPERLFTKEDESFTLYSTDGPERIVETSKNSYTTLFLGKTIVTYNNPLRKSTFGENCTKIQEYKLTSFSNESTVIKGSEIHGEWAHKVRNCEFVNIEVFLS